MKTLIAAVAIAAGLMGATAAYAGPMMGGHMMMHHHHHRHCMTWGRHHMCRHWG